MSNDTTKSQETYKRHEEKLSEERPPSRAEVKERVKEALVKGLARQEKASPGREVLDALRNNPKLAGRKEALGRLETLVEGKEAREALTEPQAGPQPPLPVPRPGQPQPNQTEQDAPPGEVAPDGEDTVSPEAPEPAKVIEQATEYRQRVQEAAQAEHQQLAQHFAELHERHERLGVLEALDPAAGLQERAALAKDLASFAMREQQFQARAQGAQQALHVASSVVAFGTHNPTREQVNELANFAADELGWSPQKVIEAASSPEIVQAVAKAWKASKGSRPGAPRKVRGAAKPTQGLLRDAIKRAADKRSKTRRQARV